MQKSFIQDKKRICGYLIDLLVFAILLAVMGKYLWNLVYAQTIYAGKEGGYHSDILAYMQTVLGIESGYSFPYPIFFELTKFFLRFTSVDYAITIAEVLLNTLSIVLAKMFITRYILKRCPDRDKWYVHLIVTLSIFGLFMMSMWWLPRFGKYKLPHKDQVYKGTFSGNPWHNATYIATRPFAIGTFFSFIDVLSEYEKKINFKNCIVFSIWLLLTTLTKPSFTFVFVSAAGLIMAYRWIKNKFAYTKNTFLLGAFFIPTFITLLFQFSGVFGSGNTEEVHGIGFSFFEVWKIHNPHIIEAIFYANVFSLFGIVLFFFEIKKDEMYRFSILTFIVSVLEAGLLVEKGKRFSHFNFSWGYMHGIFFFEMATLIKLLEVTIFRKKTKRQIALIVVAWILFLSQVVAGVLYFKGIYCGYDYETLLPASWL